MMEIICHSLDKEQSVKSVKYRISKAAHAYRSVGQDFGVADKSLT